MTHGWYIEGATRKNPYHPQAVSFLHLFNVLITYHTPLSPRRLLYLCSREFVRVKCFNGL